MPYYFLVLNMCTTQFRFRQAEIPTKVCGRLIGLCIDLPYQNALAVSVIHQQYPKPEFGLGGDGGGIKAADFVDAGYGGYVVDDGFELGVGVDAETDLADHYVAVGAGVERFHGEMECVGYAVDKIDKQVAAVDGAHS